MDIKQKLLAYLQSRDLMVLATCDNTPTAATVYYGINTDFTLYMLTSPGTEHGKNIARNQHVACVITDTNQSMYTTTAKIGVQLKGTAQEITDVQEIKLALQVWSKFHEDRVAMVMKNITENNTKSRPYAIRITEATWINEELFGKDGKEKIVFT